MSRPAPERLGIMAGTFDPIHFGHLVAAEEARVRFRLERVIFVPNGQPPHKKDYSVTPAERRYDMVVLGTGAGLIMGWVAANMAENARNGRGTRREEEEDWEA